MKLQSFNQFVNESAKPQAEFKPKYFDLPYSIPEDRFEGGLLKGNDLRRTSAPREIKITKPKYSSLEELFSKNPIERVEKKVLSEINRVVKFISNNKLTGKSISAKFVQETSLEEYMSEYLEGEDVPLGYIEVDLPINNLSFRIDYDPYKNIPVFTFWHDGDLFYYYTVFTLEKNDVTGGGESHTYITADEFIDYLFYETLWRAAISDLAQMGVDSEETGLSSAEFDRLARLAEDINLPRPIVTNYFNKNFVKLLKNWIETNNPSITDKKTKIWEIMEDGTKIHISIGEPREWFTDRLRSGYTKEGETARLVGPRGEAIAIKFKHDPDGKKIEAIEWGNYPDTGFYGIEWKPLTQSEVDNMYLIEDSGEKVYVKKFMN